MITTGTTFSFDTTDLDEPDVEEFDDNFFDHPELDNHKISFNKPFHELKSQMNEECDGVWKKTYKEAKADAVTVDFTRHRVTYHRNFYMQDEDFPFDSTWMNGKPGVICNDTDQYLLGLIEALATMKEGEKAYFIISYKKMFREEGCPPRVMPKSDILCDLYVMKVEEIGNEESIQQLKEAGNTIKTFDEAKKLTEEGRLRAKTLVSEEKYKKAISIYKHILQVLGLCETSNEEEKKELNIIKVQVMTNMLCVFNLQERPQEALPFIKAIEKLCDINDNPRILFAKGKTMRLIGDFKTARDCLHLALKLRPLNAEIRTEIEKLAAAVQNYKELSWKI